MESRSKDNIEGKMHQVKINILDGFWKRVKMQWQQKVRDRREVAQHHDNDQK